MRGLGQDRDQILPGELVDRRDDRQPADELGDAEAVLHQVLQGSTISKTSPKSFVAALHRGTEANAVVVDAAFDHAIEVGERAAADKKDVRRVDRQELLVRMLATSLRRDGGKRSSRIFRSACWYLPDTSRVIDGLSALRAILSTSSMQMIPVSAFLTSKSAAWISLRRMLDVLADVAGFGECGRVRDSERHVQDPRQRLGQQRLAATGRTQQQDVGFLQLDVVVVLRPRDLNPLVVVVDGDRERALRLSWPTTYSFRTE